MRGRRRRLADDDDDEPDGDDFDNDGDVDVDRPASQRHTQHDGTPEQHWFVHGLCVGGAGTHRRRRSVKVTWRRRRANSISYRCDSGFGVCFGEVLFWQPWFVHGLCVDQLMGTS